VEEILSGLTYRNLLLSHLAAADRHLLEPLEPLDVDERTALEKRGSRIDYMYFPETAVASHVVGNELGNSLELGLAGVEGMTGLPILYGDRRSLLDVFIQIPGRCLRMPADRMEAAMAKSNTLRVLLHRYALAVQAQRNYTALANAGLEIPGRLARWLLMCHDRIGGDHINLSHDVLAVMLGIRRASVTDAIHRLQGQGLIRSDRMNLEIRDRKALEAIARGFYGPAEAEYQRLLGFSPMVSRLIHADFQSAVEREH
jgi:CRP-like cAMP-binding protein